MSLKRKRSSSAVSPSTSSNATASSRDPSSSPSPDIHMLNSTAFSPPPVRQPDTGSSYLHSRTRKRFRDNRPDENTIHEITYSKLFAAARSSQSQVQSTTPSPQPQNSLSRSHQPSQRQHSLHTYWSIPSSAPCLPNPMIVAPVSVLKCEDCEASLDQPDTDISMGGMEDEDVKGEEFGCRCCGRRVCGMCAVVEVDAGRECLQCRTSNRKKWVGGIGWML